VCAAEDIKQWNIKNKATYRDRFLKRTYGISEAEYLAMLLAQDNCCPLCEREFSTENWCATSPVVDHCHVTGHVRGVLCNECNRGLGYYHDNPEALVRAAFYVSENKIAVHEKWKA
jgi:hypothetical protein